MSELSTTSLGPGCRQAQPMSDVLLHTAAGALALIAAAWLLAVYVTRQEHP